MYFNGLEDNNFASHLTDKLGRSGRNTTFNDINRLWLQYIQSAPLDLKNNPIARIKKAGKTERQCAVRISIKHTQMSQYFSSWSYNVRTKKRTRKWKQRVFADSRSGFDVMG